MKRPTRILGWFPADPGNYVAADRPRSHPIDRIILHVTQGSFAGTLSWFGDPDSGVSAHYTIRASDGAVAQSVRERDIAHHAGNPSYNETSIGVEHEGYVDDPALFTEAMLLSSTKLTAYLAHKYGIPADRRHIIGHVEVPHPDDPDRFGGANGHTDPGPYLDWERYMHQVSAHLLVIGGG
ncbi:MAG: N-acetylmuramoyl-L-alanine amidase [Actinomycetota bacterium]|nr:N-acetylmuramoyl-L-alanine amidase [Actinomycetota bacterium]